MTLKRVYAGIKKRSSNRKMGYNIHGKRQEAE
jgi:hypothetical protein